MESKLSSEPSPSPVPESKLSELSLSEAKGEPPTSSSVRSAVPDLGSDDEGSDDGSPFLSVASPSLLPADPKSPSAIGILPGLPIGGLGSLGGRRGEDEKDDTEQGQLVRNAEAEVMIVFELPDGSQTEAAFKMGHSVEYLKAFLHTTCSIPMPTCALYLEGGKVMLDPMSLMDYEEVRTGGGEDIFVRVEGDMEEEDVRK
mmetsp:Transcript_1793/g.3950  ORF Transcript_1793/g.3950 Transcript_1793/m.3950 type:complete len:201 (-) Transcript_1793:38-640(-)